MSDPPAAVDTVDAVDSIDAMLETPKLYLVMNIILAPYIENVHKVRHECRTHYTLGRMFYLIPRFRCYDCFGDYTGNIPPKSEFDTMAFYGLCDNCLFGKQPPDKVQQLAMELAENGTLAWHSNKQPNGFSLCRRICHTGRLTEYD